MSSNVKHPHENLFSSVVSDIKSYNGMDPLLPWLRGIRKMKEMLPPQLLKEKLPRFLQKCTETFISDRRYSNDLRYLRVWLQLMDFVDEPRAVLKTMEMNRIGMKKSLFYQAYALYYEKIKKFDAAENIYHLGVRNLAEPADELQKSYEQFLRRLERHKNKRVQLQGGKANKGRLSCDEGRSCKDNSRKTGSDGQHSDMWCKDNLPETEAKFSSIGNEMLAMQNSQNEKHMKGSNHKHMAMNSNNIGVLEEQLTRKVALSESGVEARAGKDENKQLCSDDTVVVRFVDTAIVGKSDAEDARHHGLIEPTVNTKEAMNAINSMFCEPLEPSITCKNSRKQSSSVSSMNKGLMIFSDESIEPQQTSLEVLSLSQFKGPDNNQPPDESFEIYVDGEETVDVHEKVNGKGIPAENINNVHTSSNHASLSTRLNGIPSEYSNPRRPIQDGLREDTVVHRFVGSTICKAEEPKVENVLHHGLVEPTVNFKEAMKDINSMFGKPIEFTRKSRPKKQDKAPDVKVHSEAFLILPDDDSDDSKDDAASNMFQKPPDMALKDRYENRNIEPDVMGNHSGFLILPDDEPDDQQKSSMPISSTRNGSDLFEQTMCTKEAMDEINKLFSMPMDF